MQEATAAHMLKAIKPKETRLDVGDPQVRTAGAWRTSARQTYHIAAGVGMDKICPSYLVRHRRVFWGCCIHTATIATTSSDT